jgi:hypothetical protein
MPEIGTQTEPPTAPVATAPVGTSTTPTATVATQTTKQYRYYPAPPVISSYYKYQNVNADQNLQHTVTLYFLEETIDWMKYDKSFKRVKKYLRDIKGPDGYNIIYKLLRLLVKRGNTNWYDLKIQSSLVKNFIRHKLESL